jgi:hypothetical protein
MKPKYYAHAQGFSANNRIDEPVLFYQLLFSAADNRDNRKVEWYPGKDSQDEIINRFEKKYPDLKCVWKELTDGKSTWEGFEVITR